MSLKRSREIAERLTTTEKFKDFPWFCENYLRVLNRPETSMHGKVGVTVPLKLNPIQLDFYERLMSARKAGKPGRFIVLKARRMGLSTVTQALAFHQCLTNRDRRAFVTAVDRITTNNVFLMAKKMYDNLPSKGADGGKPKKYENPEELLEALDEKSEVQDLRPELRRNNDNELWMTHPLDETAGLNSRFEVSVADAVHSTRGFEIHYFHGSEIAFWSDPETFMLGLMQTISDDPETLVVLESTANGTGGYFHREFWKAWKGEDSRGSKVESDWEAIFYPWHSMPNYARSLPEGVSASDLLERFDEDLMGMIQEYDLSPEQAYWAYKTWMDKCQGDWNLFKQEYPGKPEEAFAFSASRVFEEPALAAVESAGTKRPIFVGSIVDSSDKASPEKRVNLAGYMEPELSGKLESQSESLWVWAYPEDGVDYIVAVDPASGRSSGDYTAIQVIRSDTREQVAEVQAKMEALQTSEIAVLLCIYYNEALLSWEINGVGHAVSLGIMQTEYWNLYQRENIESVNFDARYGWTTTVASKPVMVHVGIDIINSRMPVIRSERLMREMRMFMELTRKTTSSVALVAGDEMHKRVKVGAPPGEHDDLVMSWLQAQAVCDIEYGSVSRGDPKKNDSPPPNGMSWLEDEDDFYVERKSSIGSGWL
jgi:hypothetical protein